MNKAIIAIAVVLVLLAAAYYYWYTTQNTKWAVYLDRSMNQWNILRKSKGDVECASMDGRECIRFPTKATAETTAMVLNTTKNAGVQPLACGAAHKAVWGDTGYDQGPNHWCNTKI